MTAMHRCALLACMGLALVGLAVPVALPLLVRIVFNPSDSMARGWYRVDALDGAGSLRGSLRVGSIVLARLPAGVAAFAAQRGYLPEGVPILKRVGAVAPQAVCVLDRLVWIDGVPVAAVLAHDGASRPWQPWPYCRVLVDGELFLLSDTNRSCSATRIRRRSTADISGRSMLSRCSASRGRCERGESHAHAPAMSPDCGRSCASPAIQRAGNPAPACSAGCTRAARGWRHAGTGSGCGRRRHRAR